MEKKNVVYIQPSEDWLKNNIVSGLPKGSWNPSEYVTDAGSNIKPASEIVTVEKQTMAASPPHATPPSEEKKREIAPWERIGDPRLMPKQEAQGKSEFKPYSEWIQKNIREIKQDEAKKGNEVLNPGQAYASGLISLEEKRLREKRGEFLVYPSGSAQTSIKTVKEIERRYPNILISDGQTYIEKANKIEERKTQIAQRMAQEPGIQILYNLSPFRSFGVVAEAGVSLLSRTPFKPKVRGMLTSYSRDIIENKDFAKTEPLLIGTETGLILGSVLSTPLSIGLGGFVSGMYTIGVAQQAGTYLTAPPNKKGEEGARLFVYAVPALAHMTAKIAPKYTVTRTPYYFHEKVAEKKGFGLDPDMEAKTETRQTQEADRTFSIINTKQKTISLTQPEKKPMLAGNRPFFFDDEISVNIITVARETGLKAKITEKKIFESEKIQTSRFKEIGSGRQTLLLKTELKTEKKQETKQEAKQETVENILTSSRFAELSKSESLTRSMERQKEKQRSAERSLTSSRFRQLELTRSLSSSRFRQAELTRSMTSSDYDTPNLEKYSSKQTELSKIRQKEKETPRYLFEEPQTSGQKYKSPNKSLFFSKTPTYPKPPLSGLVAFPRLSLGDIGIKSITSSKKNTYNPSLAGLVSGRSIKKTPKGTLTGLEIRLPLYTKKSKTKRGLF